MGCSLPGSSVHGILQARTLEWLPFPSVGDLPDPGIETASPALAGGFFFFKLLSHQGSPEVAYSYEVKQFSLSRICAGNKGQETTK